VNIAEDRPLAMGDLALAGLATPYPTFIDYAVPGNRACGVCPGDVPAALRAYCDAAEPAA
jgi:hypothetical protein